MCKYRRGVRRYLTAPRKGSRHYGSQKAGRKNRVAAIPSSEHQESFLGFETHPENGGPGSECKPLTVLSLFDGISAGLQALKTLGFPILRYFASEICKDAMRVQSLRHPEVIRLGDVREITPGVLESLGDIHLLIGGSPCADLSRVNPLRKGLHGGSGLLYFEFLRILRYYQRKYANTDHPFYWMFENTTHMDASTLKQLTDDLGRPVMKCASGFLPVRRKRLFWGNFLDLPDSHCSPQTDLKLQDCIDRNKSALISRARTLTSNRYAHGCPVLYDDTPENFSPTDYERLQGFEAHYTDANLSSTTRMRLVGRSWCLPVVIQLLSKLIPIFKQESGHSE